VKQPKKRTANPKAELRPLPCKTSWKHTWLCGLLLAAITIIAYARACRGEFLWDDDANIINNLTLRSLAGLRQIWLRPGATQQYYPVTHTSFWVEYHLWGARPAGYHVTNILLHALSAVLLWKILRRLKVPGAWLGAALFALHPVGVESVAWITERKNTLASVFYLGSLLAGLSFWLPELAPSSAAPVTAAEPASKGHGPWKFYWLTLALYLCALGSKTATIGLPAVILLLVWWKRRKIAWREVFPLLPLVAAATVLGLITLWVEKNDLGAAGKGWEFSPLERCLLAARIFWFYLDKLAWPHPLMFMYPRWTIQIWNPLAWLPVVALAAGLAILWWKRKTWGRPGLVAAGYFIIMLIPVMGFFNVYFFKFSFVCDHFQYLACMGPLALAAAGITAGLQHFRKRVTLLVPALLLLGLGALTWRQTGVYQNRETLWRDTLAHNPDSSMAHNNLGFVLLATGRAAEAIAQFQLALQSEPDNAEAHNNLGTILLRADKVDEAMQQFQMALQIKPGYSAARVNLANALLQMGRVNEAIQDYQMALQIAPDDMAAHVNLADALFHQGRAQEAAAHYETAINLAESAGRRDVAEQLRAELKRQQMAAGSKSIN
jgi:tetratricopeptide (TPR) repeat protein